MTRPSAPISYVPFPARIATITPESDDTRTFVLALDARAPALDAALPGQFVMLSLLGTGEAAFTLSDLTATGAAPGTVTITVRRVGSLTSALFALTVGARVGVRGPFGRGFPLDATAEPTLYVAGGCGLAPLKAAIDWQIHARAPGTPIAIAYGTRTPADRIFGAHLERWRGAPGVRVFESSERHAPGWEGRQGTVLDALDDALATVPATRAVLCGPPLMLARASGRLGAAGFAADDVLVALERQMRCGTGHCGHCYLGPRYVCIDGPAFSLAELRVVPDAFGLATGTDAEAC